MDCPICKSTGLSEGTVTCPQCGTDLQALNLIKKSQKSYTTQKKQKSLWILLTIFMTLAFIISMLLPTIFGDYIAKDEHNALNEQYLTVQNDLEQAKLETEKLKKEIDATKAEQQETKCEEITYTVQWGENLFSIASAVYGNGYQYTKIAADNSLANPDHILDGQKLVIRY